MRRAGIAGVSGRPRFRRIPHFASAGDLHRTSAPPR
jgi:hypothetical protein